jgi:hypothetical protein
MQLTNDPKQKYEVLIGQDCQLAPTSLKRSRSSYQTSLVKIERSQ